MSPVKPAEDMLGLSFLVSNGRDFKPRAFHYKDRLSR